MISLENFFATDKDRTGWRRPAAPLIVSACGAYKVFTREAMACYARSLSNGHKKYRPPEPAPQTLLMRGLRASVAKKVEQPFICLKPILVKGLRVARKILCQKTKKNSKGTNLS